MKILNTAILASTLLSATVVAAPGRHGHQGGNQWNNRPSFEREITVTIPMNEHEILTKQSRAIPLKAKVKAIRSNLDLSKADLKQVVVKGKSMAGRGELYVTEGWYQSRTKILDNSPRNNGFNKPGGFDTETFNLPREMKGSDITWKLHTNGRIKLKEIQVTFEMPKRRQMQTEACTIQLKGKFQGQLYGSFTATASDFDQQQAKQMACEEARSQCRSEKNRLSATFPFLRSVLECVRR